jgi:hypothetical protein
MYVRNRFFYTVIIGVIIVVGLASRSDWAAETWPRFIVDYAGDTLWALTVFLTLGFLFKSVSPLRIAVLALGIAFAVETFQLYQAHWINVVRETLPGKLLLGAGFKWSDFVCYTVGCGTGLLAELGHIYRRSSSQGL